MRQTDSTLAGNQAEPAAPHSCPLAAAARLLTWQQQFVTSSQRHSVRMRRSGLGDLPCVLGARVLQWLRVYREFGVPACVVRMRRRCLVAGWA